MAPWRRAATLEFGGTGPQGEHSMITLSGDGLTLYQITAEARGVPVALSAAPVVLARIKASPAGRNRGGQQRADLRGVDALRRHGGPVGAGRAHGRIATHRAVAPQDGDRPAPARRRGARGDAVAREFNNGLPPSLVGNPAHGLNMGLKSLQVQCNSIAPLIRYHGRSIGDLYPSHAEQFNQNINSQAMNSANLARESVDLCEHFLANALIFAVQAVELRSQSTGAGYDARAVLSPRNGALYIAARGLAQGAPDAAKPLVWNDTDGFIQDKVEGLLADLRHGTALALAVTPTEARLAAFFA